MHSSFVRNELNACFILKDYFVQSFLGHKGQVMEMDEHVKCSKPRSYKGGFDVFFEHHRMWGAVQAGEAFVLAVRGV